MSLPDVFVCTAVATNHIRGAFQYMQGKGSRRIFPVSQNHCLDFGAAAIQLRCAFIFFFHHLVSLSSFHHLLPFEVAKDSDYCVKGI